MYTKLIKFVLLLSLVLLSGFAGRVLNSPLLNRASRGRDPRHRGDIFVLFCSHCLQQKWPNQDFFVRVCPEGGDQLIPICVTSHSH